MSIQRQDKVPVEVSFTFARSSISTEPIEPTLEVNVPGFARIHIPMSEHDFTRLLSSSTARSKATIWTEEA